MNEVRRFSHNGGVFSQLIFRRDKYPKQRKKILDDQDLEQIPEEEEESEYS